MMKEWDELLAAAKEIAKEKTQSYKIYRLRKAVMALEKKQEENWEGCETHY